MFEFVVSLAMIALGENAASTSSSEAQATGTCTFWTRPATLLLIEEYKSRMTLLLKLHPEAWKTYKEWS